MLVNLRAMAKKAEDEVSSCVTDDDDNDDSDSKFGQMTDDRHSKIIVVDSDKYDVAVSMSNDFYKTFKKRSSSDKPSASARHDSIRIVDGDSDNMVMDTSDDDSTAGMEIMGEEEIEDKKKMNKGSGRYNYSADLDDNKEGVSSNVGPNQDDIEDEILYENEIKIKTKDKDYVESPMKKKPAAKKKRRPRKKKNLVLDGLTFTKNDVTLKCVTRTEKHLLIKIPLLGSFVLKGNKLPPYPRRNCNSISTDNGCIMMVNHPHPSNKGDMFPLIVAIKSSNDIVLAHPDSKIFKRLFAKPFSTKPIYQQCVAGGMNDVDTATILKVMESYYENEAMSVDSLAYEKFCPPDNPRLCATPAKEYIHLYKLVYKNPTAFKITEGKKRKTPVIKKVVHPESEDDNDLNQKKHRDRSKRKSKRKSKSKSKSKRKRKRKRRREREMEREREREEVVEEVVEKRKIVTGDHDEFLRSLRFLKKFFENVILPLGIIGDAYELNIKKTTH